MATNKLTVEQKRRQLINANKVRIGFKQYFCSCIFPTNMMFIEDYQHLISRRYPELDIAYNFEGRYYLISHPINSLLELGDLSEHEINKIWNDWILFLKLSKGFKKLWRLSC